MGLALTCRESLEAPMSDVFSSHLEWTGARLRPPSDLAQFSRNLSVTVDGQTLAMSSAPAFHGDPGRVNPEQLYVAALSACQALTYLALAARKQLVVSGYADDAEGWLERVDGQLRMSRVRLRPHIVLPAHADERLARELVERAHQQCFIGNSVTAVVTIEPTFEHEALSAAG
jgi:organic hydroperoxide reductase OsmC/OhrA